MKTLMTISASLFALVLSSSAFAGSRTLLVCRNFHPMADAGYQLVVTQIGCFDHPAGGFNCHMIGAPQATLSEETFAGARVLGTYTVTITQAREMGAPRIVAGQDGKGNRLRLEVIVDSTPAPQGTYSRLMAETSNGRRVVAELACRFGN